MTRTPRTDFSEDVPAESAIPWVRYGPETDFLAPLKNLDRAIQEVEKITVKGVRAAVLQDYANWCMERDCWQPPDEAAIFLHISVVKYTYLFQILWGI